MFVSFWRKSYPNNRADQIICAINYEMREAEGFRIVRNITEANKAKEDGKIYVFIGLEGLSYIGKDFGKIERLHELGAVHGMLTWNEENELATGVAGNPSLGITKYGKKAIKLMEELNMLVNVSHLNEKSFWDVMNIVTRPIVASHSNAKRLSDAARNLTDEQLIAIKEINGLVGINSFNLFVSQDESKQDLTHLVKHIIYIAEKIGTQHIGFGFDFFEFLDPQGMSSYSNQDTSYTKGFEDASKIPNLLMELRKAGFSHYEIMDMAKRNWHRILHEILG